MFHNTESKQLEKKKSEERQSPELAKGEAEKSEKLNISSEVAVILKSNLGEIVRIDEITLKEQRDLGTVPIETADFQDVPAPFASDLKLKGVMHSDDNMDDINGSSDDDDHPDAAQLKAVMNASLGSTHGSSSKFMESMGKSDNAQAETRGEYSYIIPEHIQALRRYEWDYGILNGINKLLQSISLMLSFIPSI